MNFTSFASEGPLPMDHRPKKQVNKYWSLPPLLLFCIKSYDQFHLQVYYANQLAPFAAQLVGQVLSCPANSNTENTASETQQYIRWLLNDGVVPLTGITGCAEDKNGLCLLSTFISSMRSRVTEVDFAQDCNGNYTFDVWTDKIIDGRPSKSMFSWTSQFQVMHVYIYRG